MFKSLVRDLVLLLEQLPDLCSLSVHHVTVMPQGYDDEGEEDKDSKKLPRGKFELQSLSFASAARLGSRLVCVLFRYSVWEWSNMLNSMLYF